MCDVAGQVVVDAVDKEGAAALRGIDAGDVVAGVGIVGAGGLAGGASDFDVPIKFTHDPAHTRTAGGVAHPPSVARDLNLNSQ